MSIEQRVKLVIAEQLGLNKERVQLTDNIYDDLAADSLDAIEVLMAIEEEFEIDISDEEAMSLDDTVQSIVDLVDRAVKDGR